MPPQAGQDDGYGPTLASIVLNYNYSEYVGQAIESLLAQQPPPDEIIVVDDGSTDDSLDVITRYSDQVTIRVQSNGGQISASIAGLSVCESEYVHFLDADDYVREGFVAAFHAHAASRPVKLQFQMLGVDGSGKPLGSVFPNYPPAYSAERMRLDNENVGFYMCPPTSGNIYRKDALRNARMESFDPRESVDGPVALMMPYLGAVISVNSALACYRVHGRNLSQHQEPTPELMQDEVDKLITRWTGVCAVLAFDTPPFGNREPLYVTERLLIMAVLRQQKNVVRPVLRYCTGVRRSHVTPKQSLVLVAWALLLLVPSQPFRSYLVRIRRSAAARPTVLRRALQLTRRRTRDASPV